jgi:hypothetical protein
MLHKIRWSCPWGGIPPLLTRARAPFLFADLRPLPACLRACLPALAGTRARLASERALRSSRALSGWGRSTVAFAIVAAWAVSECKTPAPTAGVACSRSNGPRVEGRLEKLNTPRDPAARCRPPPRPARLHASPPAAAQPPATPRHDPRRPSFLNALRAPLFV